jgi:2-polyprenyl-6-methoxyphenol hydroxylase-like FAD-dependent oxidoreductase
MKILIIGAGIGGLSLAAFLNDSDIEYEIIEKSPNWNHQGYSLAIWNNGRHILAKLGLSDLFDKSGKRIQNYNIYDGKGNLLRSYNLKKFYSDYGLAMTLVGRKDIHDWLYSKIDITKVRMNEGVEFISQDSSSVTVTFNTGESRKYDLVIGADGIHSKTRSLIFKDYILSSTKWRVWWMWVDNKFKTGASVSEYLEPREFVSLFDSGEKTLAIVAAVDDHTIWESPDHMVEKLKKTFKDDTTVIPDLFDTLKNEEIVTTELNHVRLKNWIKGRVILLGDAAHGFEPHGGIGGSMALEDGYVLAGELIQVSKEYLLPLALKNYEKSRKRRVKIARKLTNKMRAWALIKSPILRKIVNLIIPYFPEKYFVKDYDALLKEEI